MKERGVAVDTTSTALKIGSFVKGMVHVVIMLTHEIRKALPAKAGFTKFLPMPP
ncbi:hypothetical protein SDC9_188860 [bioreactor metagenome]|uniref:Uncharacterized protein n=1 Tax=bioreactor metagenome TaxID=1076179 RepID=A0A645HQS2_9ZZZZ